MNNSEFSGKLSLDPILQKAIASLDLQIDTELARYRKKRSQENDSPNPNPKIQQVSYPSSWVDLNTVSYIPVSSIPTQEKGLGAENQIKPRKKASKTPSSPDLPSFGKGVDPEQKAEIISSLVHQPKPETEADQETTTQKPPEDYLESSEKLLQTLAEPTTKKKSDNNSIIKQLLTPLGVGSILLVLATSALLGSVFLTPEMLSKLNLSQILKTQENTPDSNTDQPVTTSQIQQPTIPNSPNLATEEFVPINLETLSFLEPKTTIVPTPPPSPTKTTTAVAPAPTPIPTQPKTTVLPAEAGTSNLANALLPPSLRPQSPPPTLDRVTIAPLPSLPTTPTATSFYVVAEYKGDPSLESARRLIKDAFVRDFPQGKRIQVGFFPTQAEAEKFANNLKSKGLAVSILSN
jgi:hypothetical protein